MIKHVLPRVAEPFSKWGRHKCMPKTIDNFCVLNWQLWRHKHWNITSLPIRHVNV